MKSFARYLTYCKYLINFFITCIRFFFPRHAHYHVVISWTDCFIVTDQPEITVHPKAETEPEGENVTLFCNADGNPPPTISWTRNGSPVNTTINSRISFSEDKKNLTITDVNRTDSGEYRCVASNELGNDSSNNATLDVQCKYSISAFLEMISSSLVH